MKWVSLYLKILNAWLKLAVEKTLGFTLDILKIVVNP